ncbi:MAG: pitrilysin family protein [Candidatus Omnitrophota bacterium]
MYKKTILKNGLRIITSPMPKMQSVALGVWIKIGGRYETYQNKGISHYLEHLLFKGSRKYSCRRIKDSIEGVGGTLNGFTSEEATCYLVKLPCRYLNLGLSVLSDMVINPKLSQEDIDKERTVILEEIKMYKDMPQSYVYDLLDELLWPNQMLGASVIGSAESVCAINKADLDSYKNKHYTPVNIVVSAAGSMDNDKFIKDIGRAFLGCKKSFANEFIKVREGGQARPQLKLLPKDTEQTHIVIGFHSFKREDPLKYAQAILHVILGANMSSRLFNELRENKGLAYEIGTAVKRFQDTGAFLVHAGIDNRKVIEAVRVILEELGKIKNVLVLNDELKRAKEFYLGQLELAMEDTMDQMLWIGESTLTLDKTYTLEQVIKEIDKLKKEDIREAAQLIFQENKLNLAMIGPLKTQEEQIRQELTLK